MMPPGDFCPPSARTASGELGPAGPCPLPQPNGGGAALPPSHGDPGTFPLAGGGERMGGGTFLFAASLPPPPASPSVWDPFPAPLRQSGGWLEPRFVRVRDQPLPPRPCLGALCRTAGSFLPGRGGWGVDHKPPPHPVPSPERRLPLPQELPRVGRVLDGPERPAAGLWRVAGGGRNAPGAQPRAVLLRASLRPRHPRGRREPPLRHRLRLLHGERRPRGLAALRVREGEARVGHRRRRSAHQHQGRRQRPARRHHQRLQAPGRVPGGTAGLPEGCLPEAAAGQLAEPAGGRPSCGAPPGASRRCPALPADPAGGEPRGGRGHPADPAGPQPGLGLQGGPAAPQRPVGAARREAPGALLAGGAGRLLCPGPREAPPVADPLQAVPQGAGRRQAAPGGGRRRGEGLRAEDPGGEDRHPGQPSAGDPRAGPRGAEPGPPAPDRVRQPPARPRQRLPVSGGRRRAGPGPGPDPVGLPRRPG